jgi:hypothetical protein
VVAREAAGFVSSNERIRRLLKPIAPKRNLVTVNITVKLARLDAKSSDFKNL